jgi:hypothetical protein
MPIVKLDNAAPGMVLAEPVANHQNRLLLEAGRRLTARHLRVFKVWGVAVLAVRGGGEEEGGRRDAPPAATDERLKARFADLIQDPVMAEIMQAAGRQLQAHSRRKKGGHGGA